MTIIQGLIASISASSGGGGPPPFTPTGNWTIEFWMKKSSSQTDSYPRVFDVNAWSAESIGYSSEGGGEYFWTGGANTIKSMGGLNDTWNHIAICGTPTDLFIFQNGIQFPGNARNGYVTDTAMPLVIGSGGTGGNGWVGKITDFHITRQAKYTNGNFTPLIGPMFRDSYTALLMSVKDDTTKYRDWSTNNWSNSGSGTFDTDTPFSARAAVTGAPFPTGAGNLTVGWTGGDVNASQIQTLLTYGDITGWTMTAEDDPLVTCTITEMNSLAFAGYPYSLGISTAFPYATGRTVRFDPPVGGGAYGSLAFNGTQNIQYVAGPIWALDVA